MVVLLDISRLIENLHLTTPTGIDRVEMAYAQHFLKRTDKDDCYFVVTWPHFSGLLRAYHIKPLIDATAARWSAQASNDTSESLQSLSAALRAPVDHNRSRPLRIGAAHTRRSWQDWRNIAAIWLRSVLHRLNDKTAARLKETGGCYIHVSQFRLNRPDRFTWLRAASIRSVFMLHDIIPITHPQYCRPGEADRHRARVETMLRHATQIVTVSAATRQALQHYLGAPDRDAPPCNVVPLGLSPSFTDHRAIQPLETDLPYFVVVGTIEPRKNLLYLLTLWQRWTQEGWHPRARLIVVGRRGWENENILELLDRSKGLAPSVIEVASLDDAGMVALLKGATALLAPSFVEGYGLPIAEALALGVPVLASDNEAHREAGGAFAEYLDPLDGRSWMQAFDDYIDPRSTRRQQQIERIAHHVPMTWSTHLNTIDRIISRLAVGNSAKQSD